MEFDKEFWTTLFFTILNLLILYFILRKILFKPVGKYMDNRSKQISDALELAREAKKKVEAIEEENKERLKEVKAEGVLILDSYKKKAETEYNDIIEKAKIDAQNMIENTQKELETQKEQLLNSVKEEIADLVIEATRKVLDKNLDEKTNKKLIAEFLDENKGR